MSISLDCSAFQFSVRTIHRLGVDQRLYAGLQDKPHQIRLFDRLSAEGLQHVVWTHQASYGVQHVRTVGSAKWPGLSKPSTTACWELIVEGFTVKYVPSDFNEQAFSCIRLAAKNLQ